MKTEEEKLGKEPAFPCEVSFNENGGIAESHQNGNTTALFNGMSKRFYAACAAMQGMLASPFDIGKSELIKKSFEYADELLKQE